MAIDRTAPLGFDAPQDVEWYKDAVIYELHVRSFQDSDGDGVGDFRGLIKKLDYLADLGVTAIWVQPFYPSPGRDDGYDIADYRGVKPGYGTVADVRRFVREAHRRGLRVITELVCNHTSDQHPWFQESRRARPGSRARDRYVWSDTADRYQAARIIFQDFETSNWSWDPLAGAYFWHRFYSHQPDLNFDDPRVHQDLLGVVDFWLGMGVDGLRLDAIPYLYEREGTNCENLPETHAFLKMLRTHIDTRFPGRVLLAEANQWPEKAVAYFGEGRGDECHMAFHFPVMPRLYMALRREDRFPIVDILAQTPPIPETAQWAMFLRNHDELTLEMVTDEERDYMIRAYADDPQARINLGIRRRLAPLLKNDRRRIELLNGLLFSLPGTPFVYYGDEIGMGDNIHLGDRDGVRTPMQWSGDANAGFSTADASVLSLPLVTDPAYHFATVNVASQQANPHSLLWWMKRLISLRRRHPAFGRGTMEVLTPDDRRVLAFLRRTDHECLLVVANLSRFARPVALDLAEFAGRRPVELFGRTPFPVIDASQPYQLTMAPHTFLWFELETQAEVRRSFDPVAHPIPTLTTFDAWSAVLDGSQPTLAKALGAAIAAWLPSRPWFRSTLRPRLPAEIVDIHAFGPGERVALVLVRPPVVDGDAALVQLLLDLEPDVTAASPDPSRVIARTATGAAIMDAAGIPWVDDALLIALRHRRGLKGHAGAIAVDAPAELKRLVGVPKEPSGTDWPDARNMVFRSGDAYVKLYRRVEPGPHPELEVGRTLRTEQRPGMSGLTVAIERQVGSERFVIGGVGRYVPNEGTAWGLMLGAVGESIERFAAVDGAIPAGADLSSVLSSPGAEPSQALRDLVGPWGETARLMGQRAGELHLALAGESRHSGFGVHPFGELVQRALYQSIRGGFHGAVTALEDARDDASVGELRALAGDTDRVIRDLLAVRITADRTRIHGDLQLGHILDTGNDVTIVDLEGRPARPLSERRIVRAPYRDLAELITSFVRVAGTGLDHAIARSLVRDPGPAMDPSVLAWVSVMSAWVLHGHLGAVERSPYALVPMPAEVRGIVARALTIEALCLAIADTAGAGGRGARLLIPALRSIVRP